ncbi:S9 family peptidase [Halobacterium litoreum]|uniref:S9 family peptidase n=1 Tax=Halobacterium litoreum TaxID=2039234 RepID=A0ABD5NHD4_9EURY|nr:S9 family peptidase [Halobacterium litoreum]UHH12634.1 S9 family peptidase [Halobacterium litoreum]
MAYDIERYLNIRSAGGPTVGPDGSVAFLLDTTGSNQVWRLDEPGAWPEQLTFHDERVAWASFSPTRDELVYGKDAGGDEFHQLHLLSGDGSEDVELTDFPDAKHNFGGWSHGGDRFAYVANRRSQATFDVYVQGREETGEDADLVLEGDRFDRVSAAGWSPSDDRLLLHDSHSNFSQDVYVLDLESGDVTHATPFEADTRFSSVAWAPDGDGVYVATDHESDTRYLGLLDPETGDIERVADGGDWSIEAVTTHHDSGRLAYVRNADGYSELTVADTDGATLDEYPAPEIPDGVVFGLSWGPDGDEMAVAISAATDNTNVHVVDVASGASERWTDASTAGIPRETFRDPELVHYETFDGREIPAFLTLPDGDGPHPVVVDFHGGPEAQRRPWFHSLRQYFVDNGYAVFEPNVRGSSGYGKAYMNLDNVRNRMDSVKDGKAGVDWLTARDDVDPDRIVAYGGSYGGFMTLASLTEYPDAWAAGVDIVGIANFVTFLENTGDWRREHREAEYGSLAEDREFLESISPINNADRIRAPLLVLHGANDPRVPVGEAEQIAEVASEHVPVEKLIFEDEGHGFVKRENRIEAYTKVVEFLDEHV